MPTTTTHPHVVHLVVATGDHRAICNLEPYSPSGEDYTGSVTLCDDCRRAALHGFDPAQAAPRVNPCPECPEGEVIHESQSGVPVPMAAFICSAGCGWTG